MGISISEIAKRAGVSPATVSRAFSGQGYVNEKTKQNILRIAKEAGYTPKKYKKRQYFSSLNNVIGVVIPDIQNSFFSKVIRGIESVTYENGYDLFICDSAQDPSKEIRCISALHHRQIRGLIIASVSDFIEYNIEYLKALNDSGTPVVLFDRDLRISGMDGVYIDNYNGAKQATQAFIDAGHIEIAIICGPTSSKTGSERQNGYISTLRQNNIPIKEEYILYGDFQAPSAYELTKKLVLTQNKVTAILTSNCRMTYGCLKALLELGLSVPEDIALISFGMVENPFMQNLNISHVSLPVPPIGEKCAKILLEKISAGKHYRKMINKQIYFSTDLHLCGSEIYPINRK